MVTEPAEIDGNREASGQASELSGKIAQFSLTAAMALIAGSIIGVGIFNLPTSLAACRPIPR